MYVTNSLCSWSYALVVATGFASASFAANPVLNRLEPQGGQRGTEVAFAAIGDRLADGPLQLLTYEPGIEILSIEPADAKKVSVSVRLAEDCRLGRHALRIRTASGLSNLLTFHVSALTEITEIEPNNTPDKAQPIEQNVVVNGLVKLEDTDIYAVEMKAGERLSVEIEAIRMGRTFIDPMVKVTRLDGTLLAHNDDSTAVHQDAFVSLLAPADGKLLVHVRESAIRGNNLSTYRLHVGNFPRPAAVFPPAASKTEATEVRWIGAAIEDAKQTVDATGEKKELFEAHAADDQGIAPSALPLLMSDSTPLLEVEPNSDRKKAAKLKIPGVMCGVIDSPGDVDCVCVSAKKGEVWDVRVWARGLRSPLDSVLRIFNQADGKQLVANDDDRGLPDSYLRLKVPADGDYVLQVEDRLVRGQPDMVYALEVSRPHAVAEIKTEEHRRFQARVIEVPRGGRTAALVTVTRRDFGGPVKLDFTNLPAGVKYDVEPLAANYNRLAVVFSATEEAELNATLSPVAVTLSEGEQEIESKLRQQTWFVRGRNNRPMWSHFARRAPVSVTETLPFKLKLIEPKAPLVRGGEMQLKIVAERNEGFVQPIAIRMLYDPPGVSSNRSRSIAKDTSEADIPMSANGSARTGPWRITVLGVTSVNGQVVVSTQLATLQVAEPYFDLTVPTMTSTPGATVDMVVPLTHRTPFEGEAELELVRLPPGVTAERVKTTAEATSATFKLVVSDKAKTGRHRGVGCRVRLKFADEPVVYVQGYSDLRIDPPPIEPTASAAKTESSEPGEKST